MKIRHYLFLLAGSLLAMPALYAQTRELPRSTPEAEGVQSAAITALFDSLTALPKTEIHSVMVLRHGKVIAETYPAPFAPEYRHTMYSCSKTFVAAAVGLAIADNRLRLTDRVATFFPELLPDSVSPALANMTVRHLLTMTSGITPDWNMRSLCADWIRTYLSKPVREPGQQFDYDSICTYLLSAIVQRVTGMPLLDYLKQRIFTPMNITEVAWEVSPEGYNTGGWGLHIQPESLAKFGLLLLHKGVWQGKQLLPAEWVEQMTTKQMETGGDGYGYQTWLCEYPGATRADGALGQYILMIPDKDMVVVLTECTLIDGRRQRRLVWNQLLPQITADQPLTAGKELKQLQRKQAAYSLPTVQGKASSASAKVLEGKQIELEPNKYGWQSLSFRFLPRQLTVTVTDRNGLTYDLPFGYRQWMTTATEARPPYSISPVDAFKGIEGPFYVAGSYAWSTPSTLRLKAHYVNWISALDISIRLEEGKATLRVIENYSEAETEIQAKNAL